MSKKTFAAAAIILMAALLFIPHIYLDWEFGVGGQVIWNNEECFIFYHAVHGGWRLTPFQSLRVLLGAGLPFTNSRGNLNIFHVHSGRMDSHSILGFQLATTVVPYKGALYLLDCLGCGLRPNLTEKRSYRWNGETFRRIDDQETEAIRTEFPDINDPIRGKKDIREQGWQNEYIAFNGQGQQIEFSQANVKYVVNVQKPTPKKAIITLRGPVLDWKLATYNGNIHLVSPAKYRAIFLQ